MASIYQNKGVRLPRFQHVSIPIRDGDQDKVRAFYGTLVGLEEKPVPLSLRSRGLVWFATGEGELELHLVPDRHLPHPEEGRHFCLEVDDLEAFRQRLASEGYPINQTVPIPSRPRFFTVDPCGNRLEFTSIEGDYRESL